MSEGKMLKNMLTEVIMNIQSFLLGEPHLYKIKRNPTLKAIQDKYKINYTTPLIRKLISGELLLHYELEGQNLKTHMIKNKGNLKIIVKFINHFQWDRDDDEDEDEDDYVDFNDNVEEKIVIENDNIKVSIQISAYWDVEFNWTGEWNKLTSQENQGYDLGDITENDIAVVLNHFSRICRKYDQQRQNTSRNKKLKSFEIRVFIEFTSESDSESNSDDNKKFLSSIPLIFINEIDA